jgi:hypothetical protein
MELVRKSTKIFLAVNLNGKNVDQVTWVVFLTFGMGH